MTKLEALITDLTAANARLKEGLALPPTRIHKDGTIQRFEFTFELAWKTLQAAIRDQGLDANSPKRCIREAARLELIDGPEQWFEFLEQRNNIAHSYNEQLADVTRARALAKSEAAVASSRWAASSSSAASCHRLTLEPRARDSSPSAPQTRRTVTGHPDSSKVRPAVAGTPARWRGRAADASRRAASSARTCAAQTPLPWARVGRRSERHATLAAVAARSRARLATTAARVLVAVRMAFLAAPPTT